MRSSFKRISMEIYFFLFIILNVVDFLSLMPADLDFFKKILSWIVIGFVLYKASVTRILSGVRNKVMDAFYVIIGFLISCVKDLLYYLKEVSVGDFGIFSSLISLMKNTVQEFSSNTIVNNFFVVGIFLLFILSVELFRLNIKDSSLLGSLRDTKGGYISRASDFVIIFLFLVFFTLTVYNFFMEWFALAIDDLILVIGLLYYAFLFINRHLSSGGFNLLDKISNTGNDFYINLVEKFSDKRTFFLGVVFVLALHMVVDFGVFIVPYITGIQNTLYNINTGVQISSHTAIFNLIEFSKSHFMGSIGSLDFPLYLEIFGVTLHYLFTLVFVGLSLLLPFYFLYKIINKGYIKLDYRLLAVYLVSVLYYAVNWLLGASLGMIISPFVESRLHGVNIETGLLQKGFSSILALEVVSLLVLIGILILARYIKGNAVKYFLYRSTFFVVFFFFIVYISMFSFSSVFSGNLMDDGWNSYDFDLNESYNKYLGNNEIRYFSEEMEVNISRAIYMTNNSNFKYDFLKTKKNADDFLLIKLYDFKEEDVVFKGGKRNLFEERGYYDNSSCSVMVKNRDVRVFSKGDCEVYFFIKELERGEVYSSNFGELLNVEVYEEDSSWPQSLRTFFGFLFYIGGIAYIVFMLGRIDIRDYLADD